MRGEVVAYSHHRSDLVKSINGNTGDLSDDETERGRRGLETTSENLGCGWRESAWP